MNIISVDCISQFFCLFYILLFSSVLPGILVYLSVTDFLCYLTFFPLPHPLSSYCMLHEAWQTLSYKCTALYKSHSYYYMQERFWWTHAVSGTFFIVMYSEKYICCYCCYYYLFFVVAGFLLQAEGLPASAPSLGLEMPDNDVIDVMCHVRGCDYDLQLYCLSNGAIVLGSCSLKQTLCS